MNISGNTCRIHGLPALRVSVNHLYISIHTSLSLLFVHRAFFLKSLVFGGHLSDVHATPSSNLACPDLVRYLPCRAHFLTYLKETDKLVLFLEVLFDTQSLIFFFFSFKSLTLSVPFCHPFCHPSCQDPYTWINTVAS